ncbi:hypothetical protein RF11_09299 [Thelohanellus kitauei]|uniref:Uncharacterized protein n=1 Tax=Thelohanellus kitauei TaxID=669202 RepID=A0A0C2IHS5_THEKT|nr:hypothetical protein RF11_09299 [Thelohanellus kitauei]
MKNDVVDLPPSSPPSNPPTFKILLRAGQLSKKITPPMITPAGTASEATRSKAPQTRGSCLVVASPQAPRVRPPSPLPFIQQIPQDSVKIGKRAAAPSRQAAPQAPLSPPTVASIPLTPPPVNHNRIRLLCAMDAVENVQTSKYRKIPQAKFEKWWGWEDGKSTTLFRSSLLRRNGSLIM